MWRMCEGIQGQEHLTVSAEVWLTHEVSYCWWHIGQAVHLVTLKQVAHFVHANFGGLFGSLRVVRFSFCKNLMKAWDQYCKMVIFTSRKFSRISENSRNSRKFPARENLLFYSICLLVDYCQTMVFILNSIYFFRQNIGQILSISAKCMFCLVLQNVITQTHILYMYD